MAIVKRFTDLAAILAILASASACGSADNSAASSPSAAVGSDAQADTGAAADAADATSAADSTAADSASADSAGPDSVSPDSSSADAASSDSAGLNDTGPDAAGPDAGTDAAGSADAADASVADAAVDSAATDGSSQAVLCPAPQPPGTVCQGSTWVCAPGYFHNYGQSACLEATCANMKAALDAALAEVEKKTHGCSGGDEGECVVIPTTTACQGSCGVAVNVGMANDVALAVGWVDEHICKAFAFADKCGYSTPKCMAPAPACVDGVCVYKP